MNVTSGIKNPCVFFKKTVLAFCALIGPQQTFASYQIPKHEVITLNFTSPSGYTNPFTSVELKAAFTSPDQKRTLTVYGFYNGDGAGGQTGNTWSIRFAGDQAGTWKFKTTSTDAALNQLADSIIVMPSGNSGPIVIDTLHPHWFKYKDGENIHLHGNFLDDEMTGIMQFSHVYLSENLTPAQRLQMIARAHAIKANKINIYLANKGDYSGSHPTTPWLGTAASNDKTRFDLARWKLYEDEVVRLLQEGLIAVLWFMGDDSNFGNLTDVEINRLLKYGMARLSAYPNVMFVQILEWEEAYGNNPAGMVRAAKYGDSLQVYNPFDRLVSIHCWPGYNQFANESWLDFMCTQPGNSINYTTTYSICLNDFKKPINPKPLMSDEFGFTLAGGEMRKKLWMAFVAGSAGTGTGKGIAELDTFFTQLKPKFWNMFPDDEVLISGNAHCLSDSAKEYICYFPVGGPLQLHIQHVDTAFEYVWFNPQTGLLNGSFQGLPLSLNLNCPDNNDWVLYIKKKNTPCSPVILNANTTPDDGSGNGTATVTASGGQAPYTFLWNNGQSSATATALVAGSYTVTVQDILGCTGKLSVTVNSVTGTIEQDIKNELLVFPNPFANQVMIQFNLTVFSGKEKKVLVSLFDLSGRIVYQGFEKIAYTDKNKGMIRLNRNNLPSGTYFFRLQQDQIILNSKLKIE